MTSKSGDTRQLAHARRKARRLALQALYQWQLTGQNLKDIYQQFLEDQDVEGADVEYFRELLMKVPEHCRSLDDQLLPSMDRKSLEEVDPVERAILRIAAYELAYRLDVPYRVAINEAVELTKKFGAEQAHTFVNGVLDKAVKTLREVEVAQKH